MIRCTRDFFDQSGSSPWERFGGRVVRFFMMFFIVGSMAVFGWQQFNRFTGERYQVLRQASETNNGRVNAIVYDRRLEKTFEINAEGHFNEIEDPTYLDDPRRDD